MTAHMAPPPDVTLSFYFACSQRDEPQHRRHLCARCTQCSAHQPAGSVAAGSPEEAPADDQVPSQPGRTSALTGAVPVQQQIEVSW